MLLRNISNVDLVAAGNVKLKKNYENGNSFTNQSELALQGKIVSESATIFPLEESLDEISLFHDFFDSKWNSLTQEKFSNDFPLTNSKYVSR